MDTIKKVLHPHSHTTTNDTTTTTTSNTSSEIPSSSSAHTHPNAETQAALGDQPNITGTDRHPPAPPTAEIHHESHQHKQPRAGHHHPRQPVGATGLPPNHKPRSDFVGGDGDGSGQEQQHHQHHQHQPAVGVTGAEAGLEGGDVHQMGKIVAESGNNFPGTNPHPAHSALGNKDAGGASGTLNPGRE